jgi:prepilin-type processing-associated H-X9-DG protein
MYCDQNNGIMPQKGPDGSDNAGNAFAPSGGVIGVDDPSLWFNAMPSQTISKSYYDMLLEDQQGGYPAPTGGGKSWVFVCPSSDAVGTLSMGAAQDVVSADNHYFLLNGTDSQGVLLPINGHYFKFGMSYVLNGSITQTIASTQIPSQVKLSQMRPASAVVVVMEKLMKPGEYLDPAVQKFIADNPGVYSGIADTTGFISNIGQPKGNWKRFSTRHHGGGNLLFADGHVSWFAWRDTQIPLSQLPFSATSDANQGDTIIWSIAGPIH